jgi:hypothetical protein
VAKSRSIDRDQSQAKFRYQGIGRDAFKAGAQKTMQVEHRTPIGWARFAYRNLATIRQNNATFQHGGLLIKTMDDSRSSRMAVRMKSIREIRGNMEV